jgi:hypothetical protein
VKAARARLERDLVLDPDDPMVAGWGMRKPSAVLVCSLLAAVPAVAFAGTKATSGDQSLQLSQSLSPGKASTKSKARAVAEKITVDYESLTPDAQVKETTKSVVLTGPKGLTLHTSRAAVCKLSDMIKTDATNQEAGAAACPSGSQVGTGTATADARPAIPQPVPATLQLFNGIDDVNPDGTPRSPGTPALILFAKTNIGVNATLPFDISGSTLELDYAPPQPGQSQIFHIQKVDLSIPNRGGKHAYVTAPTKCGPSHKWKFSMTITNFDGPSITATHSQACKHG